jgi:hypothetical protein
MLGIGAAHGPVRLNGHPEVLPGHVGETSLVARDGYQQHYSLFKIPFDDVCLDPKG